MDFSSARLTFDRLFRNIVNASVLSRKPPDKTRTPRAFAEEFAMVDKFRESELFLEGTDYNRIHT